MDIDCSWPSSLHDAAIKQRLAENILPITSHSLLPGWTQVPSFFMGDLAYPLTPDLMKELPHCIPNEEAIFNNVIRSSKTQFLCAFVG